ncbi:sugar-binding transcriptional regulator [Mycobacterium sp. NPDC003449]
MAAVARRYFLDGKSKSEIGKEMHLSRFKVARLLDEARATGLVRIEIRQTGQLNINLSDRLQEAYGLRHAVVLDVADETNVTALRESLGGGCADLLRDVLTQDDTLGLAWARSVSAMSGALTGLPPCSVVQLSGALSGSIRGPVQDSSIELVRNVASIACGPAAYFYAPMILPNATTARTLRQQPDVARALALIPQVTVAVAGIGSWQPGLSTVHDAFGRDEREQLRADGVLVDIAGVLLDRDGQPVTTDLTERMITIRPKQLHDVPEVVGIAYGTAKTQAVRIAIEAGYIDALVTHPALALELLTIV